MQFRNFSLMLLRGAASMAGILALSVPPSSATAQALNRDVNASQRRLVADKWKLLVTRFSSATPSTSELQRFGDQAYELYLTEGENSEGTLHDPASSSNFYSANFYPRMMAAYCYWKAAQEYRDQGQHAAATSDAKNTADDTVKDAYALNYAKAAKVLEAIHDLDRYDRYQFPAVQALYIDSALHTDLGDPDLITDLVRLQENLRRVQRRAAGPLTKVKADVIKPTDIDVAPNTEIAGLNYSERGVPLVLAHRIAQAETTALADIINRLHRKPNLALDIEPIQANALDPIPVVSGEISYPIEPEDTILDKSLSRPFPLPLELEAVNPQGQVIGTTAPNVTMRFRIPLDRLLPGQKDRVRLRWRFSERAAAMAAFLNLPDLAQRNPTEEREVLFNRTAKFPDPNGFTYVIDKQNLLAYQTDLPRDTAFQVEQPLKPEDSVLVTSSNATAISWWVTESGSEKTALSKPSQKITQSFLNGKARLDLTALHLERYPVGDYQFHVQLTAKANPTQADWTDGIYYTVDSEKRVAITSAALKQFPNPGFSITSRNVAFLVGIESYEGELQLANCANDAQQMFDKLTQNFGYPKANVSLLVGANKVFEERTPGVGIPLTTNYVLSSEGNRPGNIEASDFQRGFSAFLKLIKTRHANQILLFFSGHGTDKNGQDYFLTSSLEPIAVNDLLRDLTAIFGAETVHILGLYDACRDLNDQKHQFTGRPLSAPDSHVFYVPVLACERGESSNDSPVGDDALTDPSPDAVTDFSGKIKNGFFTYSLLKSMQKYVKKDQRGDLLVHNLVQGAIPVLASLMKQVVEINQRLQTRSITASLSSKQNISSLDVSNKPVKADKIDTNRNFIAAKQHLRKPTTKHVVSTSQKQSGI